jgi:malonyl-CoA O-methyltransferase
MQMSPSKIRIADSFAKAAGSYDTYAQFQRDVADTLLSRIPDRKTTRILDIGSGTGYCASSLMPVYPQSCITSLDIAEAMLLHARPRGNSECENWVCGDGESLPFFDNSFDLVVSSLAMQWCTDPVMFCQEIFRVLKPGAHAFVSTLAEKTLTELRESWSSIDSFVHVNTFLPYGEIVKCLGQVPFSRVTYDNQQEFCFYSSFNALCKELKGIGAHNINAGQRQGLTGKDKFRKVKAHFERNAETDKGISVTWDIVLIEMEK